MAKTKERISDAQLEGRFIKIDPMAHSEDYREEKQLYAKCTSGFGCDPKNRGSKVFVTYLNTGETGMIRREDIAELLETTTDYEERMKEIEERDEKQSGVCARCGRDISKCTKKAMDVVTGDRMCADGEGCDTDDWTNTMTVAKICNDATLSQGQARDVIIEALVNTLQGEDFKRFKDEMKKITKDY